MPADLDAIRERLAERPMRGFFVCRREDIAALLAVADAARTMLDALYGSDIGDYDQSHAASSLGLWRFREGKDTRIQGSPSADMLINLQNAIDWKPPA